MRLVQVTFCLLAIVASVLSSATRSTQRSLRSQRRKLDRIEHGDNSQTIIAPVHIPVASDSQTGSVVTKAVDALDYSLIELKGRNNDRVLSSDSTYYLGEVYGGKLCNGPVYMKVVVKPQSCFGMLALYDENNPSKAAKDPTSSETLKKVTISVNTTTNSIQVKSILVYSRPEAGVSPDGPQEMRYYFCTQQEAEQKLSDLKTNMPDYKSEIVEHYQDFFADTSWGFFMYSAAAASSGSPDDDPNSSYNNNNDPGPLPPPTTQSSSDNDGYNKVDEGRRLSIVSQVNSEIGSCTPMMAGADVENMDTYSSIRVRKLSTVLDGTKWVPSAKDIHLPEKANPGGYAYEYTVWSDHDSEGELPIAHYRMVKNYGKCVQGDFSLYQVDQPSDDYSGNPMEMYEDDDGVRSNLQGQFKIDVVNEALFPSASAVVNGRNIVCNDDGSLLVTYYTDQECKARLFSEKFGGPTLRYVYIEGSGSASGDYFPRGPGNFTPANTRFYLYRALGCSAGPEQPLLKKGSVGGSGIGEKGASASASASGSGSASTMLHDTDDGSDQGGGAGNNYKWTKAVFYTGDNCKGEVYAENSMRGGRLYQCQPDPESVVGPNKIYTRSFITTCGDKSKGAGFDRTFYNDLDCSVAQKVDWESVAPLPTWASFLGNDGECSNHSFASEKGYAAFQAKSWRYECSDTAPYGLGYSITEYSEPGCKGMVLSGETFSLDLGLNYSAPSQDPKATPNTAAYKMDTSCSKGQLVTKLTARKEEMVEFYEMTSYRDPSCVTTTAAQRGISGMFSSAQSVKVGCDHGRRDSHDDGGHGDSSSNQSDNEEGLSGGAVAGVVIAVLVSLTLMAAGWYIYQKHQLPLPKPASQRKAEAEAAAAEEAARGARLGGYPPTTSSTAAVFAPFSIEGSTDALGNFSHANPLHKSVARRGSSDVSPGGGDAGDDAGDAGAATGEV